MHRQRPLLAVPAFATAGAMELRRVVRSELAKELTIDRRDGHDVPPLLPKHWTMQHTPGTRHFTMSRKVTWADLEPRRAAASARSVLFAQRGADPHAPANVPAAGSSTPVKRQFGVDVRPRPRESGPGPTRRDLKEEYCRLELRAAFRTVDPSYYDPAVDLCEWVPFDVAVVRPPHAAGQSLLLRLASANSQLRVRRMQLLPRHRCAPWVGVTGPADTAASLPVEYLDDVLHRQREAYAGPEFRSLSPGMRRELEEYTTQLGVDLRLSEFVCQALYHLEHQEYLAWLQRVADTVVPPALRRSDTAVSGDGLEHVLPPTRIE